LNGFSTALLLDLHQSGILQFPQGVDRFLPSAVEQLHYLVDGYPKSYEAVPNTDFKKSGYGTPED